MCFGHNLSPVSFSYALLIFPKHIFPPSCFHAFAFVLNPWGFSQRCLHEYECGISYWIMGSLPVSGSLKQSDSPLSKIYCQYFLSWGGGSRAPPPLILKWWQAGSCAGNHGYREFVSEQRFFSSLGLLPFFLLPFP